MRLEPTAPPRPEDDEIRASLLVRTDHPRALLRRPLVLVVRAEASFRPQRHQCPCHPRQDLSLALLPSPRVHESQSVLMPLGQHTLAGSSGTNTKDNRTNLGMRGRPSVRRTKLPKFKETVQSTGNNPLVLPGPTTLGLLRSIPYHGDGRVVMPRVLAEETGALISLVTCLRLHWW